MQKVLNKLQYILFKEYYLFKYGGWFGLKDYIESIENPPVYLLNIYYGKLAKYGSWIGHNTNFSTMPCFPHGLYGIFISGDAKIGKNVVIFQQVTIGSNTLNGSNTGSPIIGDNVYIGAGAKIIGDIIIGDNCRIGANAVVYKSLESNSVAVQRETRVIVKENLDNKYYSRGNDGWVYWNDGKWIVDNMKERH